MTTIQRQNRDAVLALFDTLKKENILPPTGFTLQTSDYVIEREFDARFDLKDSTTVINCMNEWIEVEILTPAAIRNMVNEETRSHLENPTRKMALTLQLSDSVQIRNKFEARTDSAFLVQRSKGKYQVNVGLYNDTALPRLRLLLERLCLE